MLHNWRLPVFCCLLPIILACSSDSGRPTEFDEFGWIERVGVGKSGLALHAKLDTGADHCSLNAESIEIYKVAGDDWVRFKVHNRDGRVIKYNKKVERYAKVKKASGEAQTRPVVKMFVCLGQKFTQVDVNLVDRSNFAYPMLIGRSLLAGQVSVNPAKSFTREPECEMPEEHEN